MTFQPTTDALLYDINDQSNEGLNKPVQNPKTATPWFLYVIKTFRDSLYTGITTDVSRRFAEHTAQSSKTAKALRGRGPLQLCFCTQLCSHGEALRAEFWLKKQSRANKLKIIRQELALPFEHKPVSLPLSIDKNITKK